MNYIAYFVTLCSIIGTVANSLQKRWCFWVWICTNTFWCIYNIVSGSYAQALLYAFNFAMAIIGLVKWKKNDIKSNLEKYGGRIKCNSPIGYISKHCAGKKTINNCLKCDYHEIKEE